MLLHSCWWGGQEPPERISGWVSPGGLVCVQPAEAGSGSSWAILGQNLTSVQQDQTPPPPPPAHTLSPLSVALFIHQMCFARGAFSRGFAQQQQVSFSTHCPGQELPPTAQFLWPVSTGLPKCKMRQRHVAPFLLFAPKSIHLLAAVGNVCAATEQKAFLSGAAAAPPPFPSPLMTASHHPPWHPWIWWATYSR